MDPSAAPLPVSHTRDDLAPLRIIRTETVLSRLPIHNLAKKGKVDIRITRRHAGGQIDLRWEVSYSDRYGQPRQLAYKLDSLVVNRRLDEQGRPLPKLVRIGSLKQICKDLGITESGKNTRSIRTALLQNATAFINANLVYRGADGLERRLDAGFTRYGVIFTGETLPDGASADAVYIVLNDPYRDVVNQAPVRPLNYDYLRRLTPAAQRFYEIVSYRIFAALKNGRPSARMLYSEYCIYSAQQRYFDHERFRVQMYKLCRTHLHSGYLAGFRHEPATDAEGKPDWLMSFTPGPRARAEFATFTGKRVEPSAVPAGEAGADPAEPEGRPELVAELARRGITPSQAQKLALELAAGQPAMEQLAWGDYLLGQPAGRSIRNPAGFYVTLLRDNVPVPASFAAWNRPPEAAPTASAPPDPGLQLAYEEYRAEEVKRHIAARVSPEAFAAVLAEKRREYAARYRSLDPAMLDEIAARAARAEFEPQATAMSFEEFCRSRAAVRIP